MARLLFSDRYFEQLLSEQTPPPALFGSRQPNQTASSGSRCDDCEPSAFSSYPSMASPPLPPPPPLSQQPRPQPPTSPHSRATRPKRHQRPAHKEAELRRLFKIREGVQLLTDLCGISRDRRHASEAATLRECRDRMLEAELAVVAQRQELDRLRRSVAASAMPAGQAIDYVQTKWLESPRFELFYKLVGKSVTDAFVSHAQQPGERFPGQWLARVKSEEVARRCSRHFDRMRRGS